MYDDIYTIKLISHYGFIEIWGVWDLIGKKYVLLYRDRSSSDTDPRSDVDGSRRNLDLN